jgi:SAM-dependent methyltransferase
MSGIPGGINAQASSEDFEFAALQEARNYRRALTQEFSPYLHGKILEVGAGIGQMTAAFAKLPQIEILKAVEPDAKLHAGFLEQGPAVDCLCGTVADLAPSDLYDGIVAINVLEHIEDDLEQLRRFRQHLKPDGRICLFIPAFPSIYAPIDRTFGHFRRYTRPGMRALLAAAGLHAVRLDYFNSLGFMAWWFNFCVLKKMVFEVEKVRFYDRCLFPLVHALESKIVRPPFGQSLLVVAGSDIDP